MDEDEAQDNEIVDDLWDNKQHGFDADEIGANDVDYQAELAAGRSRGLEKMEEFGLGYCIPRAEMKKNGYLYLMAGW
eukprot:16434756-Heterocapsa_arctica.AAC.1